MGGVLTLLSELKKNGQSMPKIYKRNVLNGKFPCDRFHCENILDGQCFDASSISKKENNEGSAGSVSNDEKLFDGEEEIILKALYTPGHTDDHVVFTLQVIVHSIITFYVFDECLDRFNYDFI